MFNFSPLEEEPASSLSDSPTSKPLKTAVTVLQRGILKWQSKIAMSFIPHTERIITAHGSSGNSTETGIVSSMWCKKVFGLWGLRGSVAVCAEPSPGQVCCPFPARLAGKDADLFESPLQFSLRKRSMGLVVLRRPCHWGGAVR